MCVTFARTSFCDVRFKELVRVRRPSGAPTIIDRISGFFPPSRGSPEEVTFLNSWSPGIVYKTKGSIGSRVDYTVDKKCKASRPSEKERRVAPERSGRSSVVSGYRGINAAFPFAVSLCSLFLSLSLLPHFTVLPLLPCPGKKPASARAPGYGSPLATTLTVRPSIRRSVRPPKQVSYIRAKLFVDPGRFV